MCRGNVKGCVGCRHWQGRGHSEWGLCPCFYAEIEPRLWGIPAYIPLKRFDVPFDYHDLKYFYVPHEVRKKIETDPLPDGVKRIVKREKDLKFIINKDGAIAGERVSPINIVYFMTHRNYGCEHFKRGKQ